MIETSDLIPLVAPLVTFTSVILSVAVYLERNDEIGKKSYNAAVSLAALTIVLGLAFIIFISTPENLSQRENVSQSQLVIGLAAFTGLLAAFCIGFGIIDNPGYVIGAGGIVIILGVIIIVTQQFSTTVDYALTLADIGITTGGLIVTIFGIVLFIIGLILWRKGYFTGNDGTLEITEINHNHIDADGGRNLDKEFVAVQNTGDETVDLSDYDIEINAGQDAADYPYKDKTEGTKLDPNAQLKLYTKSGTETIELYLNKDEPVLSNANAVIIETEDGSPVDKKKI